MALIRDFELPGTGVIVPNAYHVVTKVDLDKRTQDVSAPPDSSRPDGLSANHKVPGKELFWKAGYIGTISITIWKDAQAREDGLQPLGFLGVNASDNKYGARLSQDDKNFQPRFFVDVESADNYITQAYAYLKTTEYYSDATEV